MEYNGIYSPLSSINSSTSSLNPSLEATYGPYDSTTEAYNTIVAEFGSEAIPIGLTVGIKSGNNIVEYWFNGGTAQSNLVKKQATSSVSPTGKSAVYTSDSTSIQDTVSSLSATFQEATVGDFCLATATGGLYLKYGENNWLKIGTGTILSDVVQQTANIANAYVLSYK